MNPLLILASAVVGTALGMTGVGAGALMTPLLVLVFGVSPSTAISADLLATVAMRPVGALMHWRRGRVRRDIVRDLSLGWVPGAFLGTAAMHTITHAQHAEAVLSHALGVALVLGALAMTLRLWRTPRPDRSVTRARGLVVGLGAAGGFMVGLTSVGAGSLIMVLLATLYPGLSSAELVGTDLAQSIPLAVSASLGTLLFAHVDWTIAGAVILGGTPGVWLGSRLSERVDAPALRHVVIGFIGLSGLKYLGLAADPLLVLAGVGAVLYAATALWRRGHLLAR